VGAFAGQLRPELLESYEPHAVYLCAGVSTHTYAHAHAYAGGLPKVLATQGGPP